VATTNARGPTPRASACGIPHGRFRHLTNSRSRYADPDQYRRPLPERLPQQPRGPVTRRPLFIAAPHSENHVHGETRDDEIKDAAADQPRAARDAAHVAAIMIGVEDRVHKPPTRETKEPKGDDPKQKPSHGLSEHTMKSAVRAHAPPASQRCKPGEKRNSQEHNAARGVPNPSHPREGTVVSTKLRLRRLFCTFRRARHGTLTNLLPGLLACAGVNLPFLVDGMRLDQGRSHLPRHSGHSFMAMAA
jgi:hypothetical protein